jgi:predicted GNAT superfamily acetyltransferase
VTIDVRDITDLAGCRAAVELQVAVWGRDAETVPASLLGASIKRGGILIGAFDRERLVGFVWSMPGWRDGRPTHWSHMLGVDAPVRGQGIGERLKWAQRRRALGGLVELIEWTFDPLQAANAYINLRCLGCVASSYRVDAYGEMSGPLHRGTPTDRLIAEWWIGRPGVEARLAERADQASAIADEAHGIDALQVMATRPAGNWTECAGVRVDHAAPRVLLSIPPRFGEMQQEATPLALAWRLAARDAFTAYFARGYRAVDFFLDREHGGGAYLLAVDQAAS